MANIPEYYPYDKIIRYNEIEKVVNSDSLLSVTIQHQIGFSNISQVRKYIRDRATTPGKDDNPFDLVKIMMEAFFAHYSTCELNQMELVSMWMKLYKNSIERLYLQNVLLVPADKKSSETHYEPYIDEALAYANELAISRTAPRSAERRALKQEYIDEVRDKYRSKLELHILFSRYAFMMGGRFYSKPVRYGPDRMKKYSTLRANIINAWYEMVTPETVLSVDAELYFKTLEPKSVALKTFAPDSMFDLEQLNARRVKFTRWFNREKDHALTIANEVGDSKYISDIIRQWRVAELYANQLYNALVPRATAITNEELEEDANFIVNDEGDEDEEFDEQDAEEEDEEDHDYTSDSEHEDGELDEAEKQLQEERNRQMLAQFSHINDIDEEAAEASGDYDKYVKKQLKKQDKESKRLLMIAGGAEEADSDEDDDDDKMVDDYDDGGEYLDEYNQHMLNN